MDGLLLVTKYVSLLRSSGHNIVFYFYQAVAPLGKEKAFSKRMLKASKYRAKARVCAAGGLPPTGGRSG
jgi:hypothetical protein